jgi:predicted transcriptional regulator with HTH domain
MQQRESLEQATHGGCSKYKLPGSGRKLVEVWRDPMLQYIKMLRREDTTRW